MIAEELFELEETGQFTLGVAGEQRSLEGLAAPGTPAPVSFEQREPDEPVQRTSSEDDRRARGVVLFNGQEITREAYDRIRGVTPADDELEEDWLEEDDAPEPPPARKSSSSKRTYTCACCGRTLKAERWIYSRHTNARYCWPGECRGERKGR
jgi:hypothetical protein